MTANPAFDTLSHEEISAAPPVSSELVNDWVPIMPVPEGVQRVPPPHKLGKPSKIWPYNDEAGKLLGGVARFETIDGKITLPFIYCEKDGVQQWRWKGFPEPRPLYSLDTFLLNPKGKVLVVEGEKSAEAAKVLFLDYVITTSPGGAKAASKALWTPLKGRDVSIWPDQDEEGASYAQDVVQTVSPSSRFPLSSPKNGT
jgi:putative DNA primase/helicase